MLSKQGQCKAQIQKADNMAVSPEKTQMSIGINSDWSESSLSVWLKLDDLVTKIVQSKYSDQNGRMCKSSWAHAHLFMLWIICQLF